MEITAGIKVRLGNHSIDLKKYAIWNKRKKYRPTRSKLPQGGYGLWWACFGLIVDWLPKSNWGIRVYWHR